MNPRAFTDLPRIDGECGKLRLFDTDFLGEIMEDCFRGTVGGIWHVEHVTIGGQQKKLEL